MRWVAPLVCSSRAHGNYAGLPLPHLVWQVVLRFALAYGFRNIQKVMRDLKRSRVDYDYVEVMACPSGCLNGGGQAKPLTPSSAAAGAPKKVGSGGADVEQHHGSSNSSIANTDPVLTDHLAVVQDRFREAQEARQRRPPGEGQEQEKGREAGGGGEIAPDDDPYVAAVREWLLGGAAPGSAAARRWLHTRYHTVPKMEDINPQLIRW